MNPIVFAIPVFLASVGVEILLARRRGLNVYRTADALTSMNLGVLSQVAAVFSKVFTIGIYSWLQPQVALFELSASDWRVWFGALILYDFLYYWNHRAGHEINLLWAAHVVHHSSEDYNLSTALRQPSTYFLFSWIFYIPMALIGVPPLVFVVVGLIDLLYQFWVHTQLVGKLGWFDRVFCSPSNHRVHHGQNDYCIDKNYGGILIVWDRIFGTFTEEKDDEKPIYGIRGALQSWDPVWGNLHVYRDMARLAWHAPRWRDKWRVVFGPPGFMPADLAPRFGKPAFNPATFKRFNRALPAPMRHLAIAAFALSAGLIAHFLAVAEALPVAERTVYGLIVLAAVWLSARLFALQPFAVFTFMAFAAACLLAIGFDHWIVPFPYSLKFVSVLLVMLYLVLGWLAWRSVSAAKS
jgi:alkylglycerol monooxygenase